MTKSATAESPPSSGESPVVSRTTTKQASANVLGQIAAVLRSGCSKQDFYRKAFRLVASHFDASFGMLNVRIGAQTYQDEYQSEDDGSTDGVIAIVDAMILEAEAEERANVRLFTKADGNATAVLSAPIYAGAGQIGTFCLATTTRSNKEPRLLLSELIAILAFVGAQQSSDETATKLNMPSSGINRALEKAAKYASINELAYSMVNNIAAKFNCEQVAFGLQKEKEVRVIAISGLDRFSRSGHGVTQIQQAMGECTDAGESIHYQLAGGFGESSGKQSFLLHRQWHAASNNASLLSIPMITPDGEKTAVVSLLRSSDRPFTEAEIRRIRKMLHPFASVVKLLERASRTQLDLLKESIFRGYKSILEPGRKSRKIAAALAAAALLFFAFGSIPHTVIVPCHVEPTAINHVTAPYQGTIRHVTVKNGDIVREGQAIALLDARPMELERTRLRSEIASYRIEMDRALANRSPAEAAMAQTSIRAAETQLEVVQNRLNNATIVAPIDGVVLKGELDQRVGQMVMFGDPLLEIGVNDGLNVHLYIPEDQAPFIKAGQAGRFSSFAHPGDRLDFDIERIAPASVVVAEQNVFVADAKLHSFPQWMRVGMEGTARVQAGWRSTWWVATHGLVNRVRMLVW